MKINRRNFLEASVLTAATGVLTSAIKVSGQGTTTAPSGQKPFSTYDTEVDKLLSQMTLEEKVGQMVQAEQSALKDMSDIEKYFLGSIFSGGGSDPKAGNSLVNWTDLYDSLQSHTRNTRLRIPILFGIDAVHGHSNVLNATIFPHNVGLGCTRNPQLVEQAAQVTAREVRATGINWTFSPCVTVPRDIRWGRSYEGFGESPELASDLGEAAVRGLLGKNLNDEKNVLACAKHFVVNEETEYEPVQSLTANPPIRIEEM